MSYLDQLDSFSSDLNQQHEQMTASLGAVGQRLQEQFNEEFNKTIEQMELAGGAVSTAGLGLSGVNKSYKGFKMWKDARTEKLKKARADFERTGRAYELLKVRQGILLGRLMKTKSNFLLGKLLKLLKRKI